VQLGRAAEHSTELAAMRTTEFTPMSSAEHAAEFAAMCAPEFTTMRPAMLAAIFAFTRANDAAFDSAHQVKDLKHLPPL
jgi:hypothetical protein